jgi:predicted aspartyl protease
MATKVETMGRVTTTATIESVEDLFAVRKGELDAESVRTVEVDDALVDTGATMLSMPHQMIEQLGLHEVRRRTARTPAGVRDFTIYSPVQLTIQGRACTLEVSDLPDDCPVLIGQIPLELLDWVVDPVNQRLIGNPAHGGDQMMDMF